MDAGGLIITRSHLQAPVQSLLKGHLGRKVRKAYDVGRTNVGVVINRNDHRNIRVIFFYLPDYAFIDFIPAGFRQCHILNLTAIAGLFDHHCATATFIKPLPAKRSQRLAMVFQEFRMPGASLFGGFFRFGFVEDFIAAEFAGFFKNLHLLREFNQHQFIRGKSAVDTCRGVSKVDCAPALRILDAIDKCLGKACQPRVCRQMD